MFKMVAGNNGRTVYCGVVTRKKDNAVEIKGEDWNWNLKAAEERCLQMSIDRDIIEECKEISVGDHIVVTMLPSRKNENVGTAEEVGLNNRAITIRNERGNEKIVIIATVKSKKWSDSKKILRVNFMDVKDMDGNMMGNRFERQDQYGMTYINYYLNVTYFLPNEKVKNSYNATKVDKDIEPGDKVVMVVSRKESQYNGKTYVNYNGGKFSVLKKKN